MYKLNIGWRMNIHFAAVKMIVKTENIFHLANYSVLMNVCR